MVDPSPPTPDGTGLDPATPARSVAILALIGVIIIMALKFIVFGLTNSSAVLADALESIVNIAAAAMAIFSTWYAARPPDREHPYGHGNVEFVAVAVEGMMVAAAGVLIAYEALRRLALANSELHRLDTGLIMLGGVGLLMAGLAAWVWRRGVTLDSPTLIADGKHLMTDVITTIGTLIGLGAVRLTNLVWLDPAFALAIAGLILVTGWRLVRESWSGIMDKADPADEALVLALLDEHQAAGRILSYHKVRMRHQGSFHWVDLHIQVPGTMTVAQAHDLASRIEFAIEQRLRRANATAHIEPAEPERPGPGPPPPAVDRATPPPGDEDPRRAPDQKR